MLSALTRVKLKRHTKFQINPVSGLWENLSESDIFKKVILLVSMNFMWWILCTNFEQKLTFLTSMKEIAAKFCWKTLFGLLLCDTYKKKKIKKNQWSKWGQKGSILVHFCPNLSFFGVIAAIMDLKWSIFFFNIVCRTNAQLLRPNLGQ